MQKSLEATIAVGAHFLGAVGMAGVWLIPSHTWQLLARRRIGSPLRRDIRSATLATLAGTALGFSFYVALDSMPRVFRCLWESWCTSTRGGGLLNLAWFGLSVLVAEVAWYFCSVQLRKRNENELVTKL